MMLTIKSLIVLLAVVLLHTSADAADKVRISISSLSGQFMTYPLAHKRGFLKEEGIEAEIIRVTGGATSAAMSSGDLDYGTGMSVGGAITGALPVKVVACFVPAPVFALVARPEIKSVQELKDKTVGISTFSGLSIFGARVIGAGEESAFAVNELIQPNAVIPSHANEAATKDGKVNPGTRTRQFIDRVKDRSVHVPLSGKTMEFDENAKCIAGC